MTRPRRRVCDISEMPDRPALTAWAAAHSTHVTYLGPSLEGHAVYAAVDGPQVRVYVDASRPDPHRPPVSWKSPLEHLDAVRARPHQKETM